MKKILITIGILLCVSAFEKPVQAQNDPFDTEDWVTFRQACEVAHYTWAAFIKAWYRKVHNPIKVNEKCFGTWIDESILTIQNLFRKVSNFDILELDYTEATKAATSSVDLIFKQDEYCYFRRFLIDTTDFCDTPEDFCNPGKILGNIQKNAMNLITQAITISELIQRQEVAITDAEI